MLFGERLKALRAEAGLSQKALAAKLFISQQAVAGWELNKGSPNPETVAKISEILNVSTDYLLGCTDKKVPAPKAEDGQRHEELDQEFMRWFQQQTPERQKEVLFDLAKAVTGHGK